MKQIKKELNMNDENKGPNDNPQVDLADIRDIAANVVRWSLRQHEAANRWPLAYINCLLDEMAEANCFDLDTVPEDLSRFAPWLNSETSLAMVSAFFHARPKQS